MKHHELQAAVQQDGLDKGSDIIFNKTEDGKGLRVQALMDEDQTYYKVPDADDLLNEVNGRIQKDAISTKNNEAVSDVFWDIMNAKYVDE